MEAKFGADGCRAFDERKPIEPSYPSITPSIADFVVANGVTSVNGDRGYTSEEEELRFAPPGYVPFSMFAFGTVLILIARHILD